MRVIQEKALLAAQVLGRQDVPAVAPRFLTYCVAMVCAEGVLLYNTLTKELLLVDGAESALLCPDDLNTSPLLRQCAAPLFRYLYDNYFIVPQGNDDKHLCLALRAIARELTTADNGGHLTHYTILTTTACNARCFYCYEKGAPRQQMSAVTAQRVVAFIKEHCGGRRVALSWFGGEPLYNTMPIDIISQGLRAAGIAFSARMTTNGYLFDDAVVAQARACWQLQRVQITLDGTEHEYNRRKAYIYPTGSAFLRVIDNISRLLAAGIGVTVRLNMDAQNYGDLCTLSDDLLRRFGSDKAFRIYVAPLSSADGTGMYRDTIEDTSALLVRLRQQLRQANMPLRGWLGKTVKSHACMADDPAAVVIQTDGTLGRCQHYFASRPCGTLDEGITDQQEVDYWLRADDDSALCDACALYPSCCRLAACQSAYNNPCKAVAAVAAFERTGLQQAMLRAYNNRV